jgi:choline dehydrogenase
VIVSCGAIDSPKLLVLSGIGPAQHLREVGVEVVVDAAGVGENLQDHPEGRHHVGGPAADDHHIQPVVGGRHLLRHRTRPRPAGPDVPPRVRLRTRDYRDKPKVDPRYFTHEHGVRVMTYGLKPARRMASPPALSGWAGAEPAPGPDVRTDEELLEYIDKTHNTVYHPSCTVKMGAGDDPSAPLRLPLLGRVSRR